jgi:protein phosphatase
VLALVAVIAVVLSAIVWSGSNTYYVGFDGDQVAVYRGKPGGVLWVDPELVETTDLTRSDLPQDVRSAVAGNKEFGSQGAATRYVVTLQSIVSDQEKATTTTSTTSTTTTTTKPKASTTTTAPAPSTTAAP